MLPLKTLLTETIAFVVVTRNTPLVYALLTTLWILLGGLAQFSLGNDANKVGYTATLVACGWAGAVMEKVTRAFGRER